MMQQALALEPPATQVQLSDRLILLAYLQSHPYIWIPVNELSRVCHISPFSITARVRDLRKPRYGRYDIPNRMTWVDGVCHSSYRYEGVKESQ